MSIRGLIRQEIIDNWLNGEEDPNFDVIPTRIEGKYIVKQKTLAAGIPNSDSPEMQLASKQDDKSQTAETRDENNNDKETPDEEPVNPEPDNSSKSYVSFDRELTNEILNQLKMINDDRKALYEKKQKKKELRRAIHKEFARSRVMVEGSSDDEAPMPPAPPPQPVYIERKPIMVRRRLNLIDRYK